MFHFLGVEITLTNLLTGLAVVAILALVAAYFWYNFRLRGDEAAKTALNNWKELAQSEQAKNVVLEAENKRLQEEMKDCAQLKNEFAQFVLRTNAREQYYQRCINRLELAAGLAPTNFDDPTQHITENPNR